MSNLPIDLSDQKHLLESLGVPQPLVLTVRPHAALARTDRVHTITSTGSSGTFTLVVDGVTTAPLAFNADGAVLGAAIADSVVTGNAVSGSITVFHTGTLTVGTNGTNGTVTVAQTVPYQAGDVIGSLPKGYYVGGIAAVVLTAFDGVDPVLDVGTPDSLQAFVTQIDLATVSPGYSEDPTHLIEVDSSPLSFFISAAVNVIGGISVASGAQPTVGEALVYILPWNV